MNAVDSAILKLNEQITDLTAKQQEIEDKIQNRTKLVNQKNNLSQEINEKNKELSEAESKLNTIKTSFSDIHSIISGLNWQHLDPNNIGQGRKELAEELKNKVKEQFESIDNKYSLNEYETLISRYVTLVSGQYDKQIQELKDEGKFGFLTEPDSGRALETYTKAANNNTLNTIYNNSLAEGIGYIPNGLGSPVYLDEETQYITHLNTDILAQMSMLKAEKNNVFNPMKIKQEQKQILVGHQSSSLLGLKTTSASNEARFIMVDTKFIKETMIKNLTAFNKNPENLQLSVSSKYSYLKDYIDSIDWTHDKSVLSNLSEYKSQLDGILDILNKGKSLEEEYASLKTSTTLSQAEIEQKTKDILGKSKELLHTLETTTTFEINPEYNEANIKDYLFYAKDDADAYIQKLIQILPKYDPNNTLVKDISNEIRAVKNHYTSTLKDRNNIQDQLNDLNQQIDALALTPSEEAVDDLKRQREEELATREADKARLEKEKQDKEAELERLREILKKSSIANLGENSYAQGKDAFASGDNSIAIGHLSDATKTNTIAVGNGAKATIDNSVALGSDSKTTAEKTDSSAGTTTYNNAEVIDNLNQKVNQFAGATATGVVSVGKVGAERRIQNVAAGLVSEKSTDAVNGSQLYALANAIQQGQTGLVQQGDATENIQNGVNHNILTVGATTGGQEINFANVQGTNRRLSGVAEGINTYDAVNKGQLDKAIAGVNSRIAYTEKQLKGGIANSIAMASLPQAYSASQGLLSVATGHYRGSTSVALGLSRVSDNGRVIFKLNGSASQKGEVAAGAGIGFAW